jgi:3-oxoacyl-[acyl-carrier-protein] synthase-3
VTVLRSVIKGCGGYLPKRILSNRDLAQVVDTSDDWIQTRTGIKQRHIAADGELTSSMGTMAARLALDHAGLKPEDIDLIILATSTPDQTFPATAVTIQADLGINHGAAFDVQAVCSGFVFALASSSVLS